IGRQLPPARCQRAARNCAAVQEIRPGLKADAGGDRQGTARLGEGGIPGIEREGVDRAVVPQGDGVGGAGGGDDRVVAGGGWPGGGTLSAIVIDAGGGGRPGSTIGGVGP